MINFLKKIGFTILMAAILLFSVIAYHINDTIRWKYSVSNFDKHYDDYAGVMEIAKGYEGEVQQTGIHYLTVDHDHGNCYLSYQGKRIELNQQQQDSLNTVDQSFTYKDSVFDTVRIYDNRISFNIENGQYALVYSFNDTKPSFVNHPEEDWKIYVKKLINNWYNVKLQN